jgi:hypothetical protein
VGHSRLGQDCAECPPPHRFTTVGAALCFADPRPDQGLESPAFPTGYVASHHQAVKLHRPSRANAGNPLHAARPKPAFL